MNLSDKYREIEGEKRTCDVGWSYREVFCLMVSKDEEWVNEVLQILGYMV